MRKDPLSQSQMGVFIDWMSHPSYTQYNLPFVLTLSDDIDLDTLENAIKKIASEREVFHTRIFMNEEGVPLQYADMSMEIPVLHSKMTDKEVESYIKNDFVRPFAPISDSPLCRFEIIETDEHTYLLFDMHHVICDGVTRGLFFTQDLPKAYQGLALSKSEYGLYQNALAEQQSFSSEAYQEARNHYTKKFTGVDFISFSNKDSLKGGNFLRTSCFISLKGVTDWCKEKQLSAGLLFMSAYSIVLSRFTRNQEFAFCTINHGRKDERLQSEYGMFVKTYPIKANVDGRKNVIDFIKSFREGISDFHRYDVYPFTHFCRDLQVKPAAFFSFQGGNVEEKCPLGKKLVKLKVRETAEELACLIYQDEENYEICLTSNDSLYSVSELSRIGNAIKNCVFELMAKPEQTLSKILLVSEEEQKDLIALGKGEELAYNKTETIVDLFKKQVSLYPNSTAVVDEVSSITYSELEYQSDVLASVLVKQGVGTDNFVGVMLPRRKEFLVAVMAVFKAGGAYIPLDNEYPNDRLLYMLEDSRAKMLVTTRTLFNEKNREGNFMADNILFIDEFDFNVNAISVNNSKPNSLAYMIYTSGSTGNPKGVMVEHRGLVNFIEWLSRLEELKHGEKCALHTSFSFDGSMFDLFPPLIVGGQLHILPSSMRQDMDGLFAYLKNNSITGMLLTTQLGMAMMDQYDLPLRYLMVGGEKLTTTRPTSVKLYNCYGPTEFTVCSSYHQVDSNKKYDNIPIGRSVPNSISVIVDGSGNLLPKGTAGELCLIGNQIARGYCGREELTAEKFVDCPFLPGDKMYRTGDLACWNETGELEYLGRIDHQVKLRGFRIEMGEIESRLSSFEGVKGAVAEVKEINGVQHLCAYFTADTEINREELRAYLAESLTDYMVPTAYTQLDELPLTPNGKVNRKDLPIPAIENDIEYVAPTNETEEKICGIYSSILHLEKVGINDNFFTMGGSSISAIKAVVQISNIGFKINYGDLFKLKTPAAIAEFVLGNTKESSNKEEEHFDLSHYDYTAIDELLSHNDHDLWDNFTLRPNGKVLITGATGYLGIHILHYLLKNSDSDIYCLVRKKEEITLENRLKLMMVYYFDADWETSFDTRVKVIEGDITNPNLQEKLADCTFDTLFNCAALVKHYVADNTMEKINVEGVANLVALCEEKHSLLVHVSTYSVGGMVKQNEPNTLSEQSFYIGQTTNNEYVRTKFLAERMILQAIADGKINAKIMRVGNLMGRERDGEFQMNFNNNAFVKSLKSYKVMGMIAIDNMLSPVEMSPIDKVAESIVELSKTPVEMTVFHPYNNYNIDMAVIVKSLNDYGYRIEVTSQEKVAARMDSLMHNPEKMVYLQGLLHYMGIQNASIPVKAINDYTTKTLLRLGFYWNPSHEDYVSLLIEKLDGLGFFDEI